MSFAEHRAKDCKRPPTAGGHHSSAVVRRPETLAYANVSFDSLKSKTRGTSQGFLWGQDVIAINESMKASGLRVKIHVT